MDQIITISKNIIVIKLTSIEATIDKIKFFVIISTIKNTSKPTIDFIVKL